VNKQTKTCEDCNGKGYHVELDLDADAATAKGCPTCQETGQVET
jgi:DnaJ-class molecular chaperone